MSAEDPPKPKQTKQTRAEKQQGPVLDLEAVRTIVQAAVTESIQSTLPALRETVQQVVDEILARQAEHQDLSAELGAIDAQLGAIRTATDLLAKASQAQALPHTDTIRLTKTQLPQQEEDGAPPDDSGQGGENDDDALPLPKTIRLLERVREEGPVPIDLQVPLRPGGKS